MPIITDRAEALLRLIILTDADNEPLLDYGTAGDELEIILDDSQRASIWQADTEYSFGAVIIPTVRNGHRYKLIAYDGNGVKSGLTEPDWSIWRDSRITDGNLTWEEAGADYDSLWDLRQAAYFGWLAKAAKVPASSFASASNNQGIKKITEDGQSVEFEGSTGIQHDRKYFLDMADRFMPVEIL